MSTAAALVVSFRVADPGDDERLTVVLGDAQLEADRTKTPLAAKGRRIELDLRRPAEATVTLSCPPGKYERLVLRIDSLALFARGKEDPRLKMEPFEVVVEEGIDAQSDMVTRVELLVSSAVNARALNPRPTVKATARLVGAEVQAKIDGSADQTIALDPSDILGQRTAGAGIRVGRGALPPGTVVDVRRRDPQGLPDLFPRQRRVGPVIEIQAATQPRAAVEVTVPYDAAELTAAGASPEQIVVLRLDDRRTAYHELRPYRIDTVNRTVTVRTPGFSSFFACTGGITVEIPEAFHNLVGDTLFYVPDGDTTVAGRLAANGAVVTLTGAPFASSWSRADRFSFEQVRLLDRLETRVQIRAEVAGMMPHTCDITLRRFAPPKRVSTVHRFAGPTLGFLDIGTPAVTTGIIQRGRLTNADIFPALADWQTSLVRYTGVLQEYDAVGETWRTIPVVPESYFENEAARGAIIILAIFRDPIPVDETLPEGIRFLSALNADVAQPTDEFTRRFLDTAFNFLGPRVHSLSSTMPLLQMEGDSYGVAWVASTWEGTQAANANGLQRYLDQLYGQQLDPLPLQRIPAGRLYFRRVSRNGSAEPELVAENVWCTSVAMRRHPRTGAPTILALEMRPVPRSADGRPPAEAASLLVCTRRDNGTWIVDRAGRNRPYVSADFEFDASGAMHIVAAHVDPSGFDDALNCHLIRLSRAGELWVEEPVTWVEGPQNRERRRGSWPRVAFDARGRLVLAFCYDAPALAAPIAEVTFVPPTRIPIDAGVHWFAGVLENGTWRMQRIDGADFADLTGADDGTRDAAFGRGMSAQSRAGFVHFAPSIVPDPRGTLWMAYGKGALHLAEIDLDTLTATGRTVDVDRTTGFYPSVALRDAGVPAVAYKDLFGTDDHDVHYFRLDEGNLVPPGQPREPLAPGHAIDFLNLTSFGARLPLSCANVRQILGNVIFGAVLNPAELDRVVNPLLESLIMHATFDWALLPGRAERLLRDLRVHRSHPQLADHLEQVFPRPDIIEVFIKNDRTDEDITRIDLTLFGDLLSVDDVDGRLREELDLRSRGQLPPPPPVEEEDDLPDERDPDIDQGRGPGRPPRPPGGRPSSRRPTPVRLRTHFQRAGWPLSANENIRVNAPDRFRPFWELVDHAPFGVRPGAIRQVYQIFVDGTRLTVRLPARVTVTGRNDSSARVCDLSQDDWDLAGTFLAGRIGGILPPIPNDVADKAYIIAAAGIRFRKETRDPARAQQGSVRFTANVPHLLVWGEDIAEVILRTKTPSELGFTLAPFVQEGRLRWFPREGFSHIGEIEATITESSILAIVEFLTFALFGALVYGLVRVGRALGESLIEGFAQEQVSGLTQFGGLAGLVEPIYAEWVRARFPNGDPPALEAVFLRDQILTYWTREDGDPRTTIFLATPSRLSLIAAVDGPAVRRNLLLQNAGSLPVSLDDVTLASPGGEFRIASPPMWPRVLFPGEAETVTVELEADLPVGPRNNTLQARFNGDGLVEVPLSGLAQSPRRLVVRPADRLVFGVVNVGSSRVLRVELANEGEGPLTVSAIRVSATGANVGRFTAAPAAPLTVPAVSSRFLDVTFTPQAMLAGGNEATLVIESDDPVRPRVEVRLSGLGAAGSLLVVPPSINFGNTPVGGSSPENRRPLGLFNTGAASVTINGSSFRLVDPVGNVSPHYQLLSNAGLPLPQQDVTIRSGDQFAMQVRFRPTAAGEHFATLRLTASTAGVGEIAVLMSGRGV